MQRHSGNLFGLFAFLCPGFDGLCIGWNGLDFGHRWSALEVLAHPGCQGLRKRTQSDAFVGNLLFFRHNLCNCGKALKHKLRHYEVLHRLLLLRVLRGRGDQDQSRGQNLQRHQQSKIHVTDLVTDDRFHPGLGRRSHQHDLDAFAASGNQAHHVSDRQEDLGLYQR